MTTPLTSKQQGGLGGGGSCSCSNSRSEGVTFGSLNLTSSPSPVRTWLGRDAGGGCGWQHSMALASEVLPRHPPAIRHPSTHPSIPSAIVWAQALQCKLLVPGRPSLRWYVSYSNHVLRHRLCDGIARQHRNVATASDSRHATTLAGLRQAQGCRAAVPG